MKKRKDMLMLFCFIISLILSQVAYAIGDGNIDSGGGEMADGTSQNKWSVGDEGVRVTVIRDSDQAIASKTIDFTNRIPSVQVNFGIISKIKYRNGALLTVSPNSYVWVNPDIKIPKIITSASGHSNIEEIKRYFCSEYMIHLIAEKTGMDYETLINGEYKILLEPVAYITYNGIKYAMSATEAAYYSPKTGGDLRAKFFNVLFKNVPLAMFLETPDLGFPAWKGSKNQNVTEAEVISSLGLGIIHFNKKETEIPEATNYDYTYRVNTQVITAVTVSGGRANPDRPVTARFNIDGKTYTVRNIYYPSGDKQLVWVKWRTPNQPQDLTIHVTTTGSGHADKSTIHVKIEDLDENPPPNPVADDRNDSYRRADSLPIYESRNEADWSVWRAWWHEHWVWHSGSEDEDGYWEDEGWWDYDQDWYYAALSAAMKIEPDAKSPTANENVMKSGYGINETVTADVQTDRSSAVTGAQNAVAFFPEFQYETYWRLLKRTSGNLHTKLEYQPNRYSTFKRRTHFTPIWMPDGDYTVYTWLIDCWTPKGMLSLNLSDQVYIQGSLWDDWHISKIKP
ncbi:MAG: hypothetical protein SPI21_03090 [Hungatella hathewayi]|uniref:hypothetical protein n=1 Tax=Hungatella TaxID=1649459 RepID=UPI001105E2B4|nr:MULTISPECIES: hypothetical protein [Hungatella]MCI7380773.1 hypothetical protein [Hungatella sp.]MDY6235767.1 hypothetical protein [Hungatella hathewayi]